MKKRYVKAVLVLAGLIACTAMTAACSDSKTEEKSGAAAPGSESTAPKAKPTLSISMYDRGNVPQEMGTIDNNRWTKWLNENGPVNGKYVPIPRGESVQKLNLLFASGDAPDVVFEFDTRFRDQMYQQKMIMPVDDLIENSSTDYKQLLEKYPAIKKAATKPDGNMYEFGRVSPLVGFQALLIRTDWLDKLGLQVPETTEELFAVAKAFTEQDPDDNGANDTFGIALSGETGGTIDTMFRNVTWVVEDGKLVRGWKQLNAANEFKKRLYDAGLVDKDFLADKNGQKAQQDWNNGKIGIFVGRTIDLVNFNQYYEQLKTNVPSAEVKAIKLPKSEFGRFTIGVNNPVQMTTVINSKVKDPEAAMAYIDFMASRTAGEMLRFGQEGEDSVKGSNGCLQPIDAEKFNKEVSWNIDFQLLLSRIELGSCTDIQSQLDPSKPLEQDFLRLIQENNEANLSPDVEFPAITHGEHMPTLPEDLSVINTSVSKIGDIYNKALVSGTSYTIEQAYAEALDLWNKSGGDKLETFYADWYGNNSEKAFLARDMWEFVVK
ncbi:extracellular solute-binding protein [Cohnella cellulosilytica]|uniref:Extracellular solute-binding protein n=1 Tax=Cohnella cellulosilytica TaxID=986710 RepID=A0ABW2FND1_9BACL